MSRLSLHPHQREGVTFLTSLLHGNSGGILADHMGLGKTVQILSSVLGYLEQATTATAAINSAASSASSSEQKAQVQLPGALFLMPSIVINAWREQLTQFFPNCTLRRDFQHDHRSRELDGRIRRWTRKGGLFFMTYDMFVRKRNLFDAMSPESVIVLDEGHRLKAGSGSDLYACCDNLPTRRRLVVTGYPVQTRLCEYHALVQFAVSANHADTKRKESMLPSKAEFKRRFEQVILSGQAHDADVNAVRIAEERMFILNEKLKDVVLRRGRALLASKLPPRTDVVLHLAPATAQDLGLQALAETAREVIETNPRTRGDLFLEAFHCARRLCTHPVVLQNKLGQAEVTLATKKRKTQTVLSSSEAHVVSQSTPSSHTRQHTDFMTALSSRLDRRSGGEIAAWRTVSRSRRHSAKMIVLLGLLEHVIEAGEKTVVFSHSNEALIFAAELVKSRVVGAHVSTLTGLTSHDERSALIDEFNDEHGELNVLFVATKAGGEGISLVGGNRVVLLDLGFNPSLDEQAANRVYRFGQRRPTFVYRLVMCDCVEANVFRRQIVRQSMSNAVVDNAGTIAAVDQDEWQRLLFSEAARPTESTYRGGRDKVLSALMRQHEDAIVAVQDYDMLFEAKQRKQLSPRRKTAAVEGYERRARAEAVDDKAARLSYYERFAQRKMMKKKK